MASSVLEGKYQRALLTIRELEQERDKYRNDYESLESKNKKLNKSMKNLCETILKKKNVKKDDDEIAWFKMSLADMIVEAQDYIDGYFASISDTIQQVLKATNEKTETIIKLENEMKEKEASIKNEYNELCKVKDDTIQELRDRLITGRLDEETVDKMIAPAYNVKENIDMPLNNVSVEMEDADNIEAEYVEAINVFHKENELVIPASAKVSVSKKIKQNIKKKIQNVQDDYMKQVEEYAKELSEKQRFIIRVMGETGLSEMKEILLEVKQRDPERTESSVKAVLHELTLKGDSLPEPIIKESSIAVAGTPKMSVFQLSPLGKDIFCYLFSKEPVLSEAEKIVKDHNNLEHGYGIKKTALLIKNLNFIKNAGSEVHYMTRSSDFKVKLSGNTSYIPDIVIVYDYKGKKKKMYIEYETGNCNESDFIAKCNKIASFSRSINIVVPNNEVKAELINRVDKWKESISEDGLQNPEKKRVTVKINTFFEIRDGNCERRIDWKWTKEVGVFVEKAERGDQK